MHPIAAIQGSRQLLAQPIAINVTKVQPAPSRGDGLSLHAVYLNPDGGSYSVKSLSPC
jgi:hypothetical protein